MVEYKAYEKGIKVIVTEESYTSKASFFDHDLIPIYDKDAKDKPVFSGKRVKRGLYKTKDGYFINADVNGALNTIIKAVPDAFKLRDRGLVSSPQVLSIA